LRHESQDGPAGWQTQDAPWRGHWRRQCGRHFDLWGELGQPAIRRRIVEREVSDS